MPKMKLPPNPTHRAHLVTGETVDYYGPPFGAHPTHWSFGGADEEGNRDNSPVRVVPVDHFSEVALHPDAPDNTIEEDDE